jgi:AraC-type DNA-binding domain-containing proteins
MKNAQEKIIHFELSPGQELSVTHGYNISNAFPVHFHSTYNLGIIELGKREFTYRGIKTVLMPNNIFVIQPLEPHSCKSIDELPHSYKVISFNFETSYNFPLLINHRPNLLKAINDFHAIAEFEKSSSKIITLFEEIKKLLKSYSLVDNADIISVELSDKMHLAKQFIENNCQLEISLKAMSEIACLSEYHFNRYFHKHYGISPYAYYLICKMKKLQKILIEQNSVLDTTYSYGFFDQSHFTKLFKKYVGVTPGKYLRDNNQCG